MPKSNGDGISNGTEPVLKLMSKRKISDEYILHTAVNNQAQPHVAVALSTSEIIHFDINNETTTSSFKSHLKSVTGLKFSRKAPTLLLSSSLDGNIHVWDTRSGALPVQTFYDKNGAKPVVCFDVNEDDKFICAGTELIREDAFLLFWDRRSTKFLGGYWNSHTDEITQVQFHSLMNSGMSSSSVDGLFNIFDLDEASEEDALEKTLNIETSINRYSWRHDGYVSCITGTEEYQFWSTEDSSPSCTMARDDLSELSHCKVDYLVDTFAVGKRFYLASGSNTGDLQIYSHQKKLKLLGVSGEEGHTDIIRSICFSKDCFITGGEDGRLCSWKIC